MRAEMRRMFVAIGSLSVALAARARAEATPASGFYPCAEVCLQYCPDPEIADRWCRIEMGCGPFYCYEDGLGCPEIYLYCDYPHAP
jgi:hypothetical protein